MPSSYDDIINLPRHVSAKHPPMDPNDRAAQFAPFAALVGHKENIMDSESLAADQVDLDHDFQIDYDETENA